MFCYHCGAQMDDGARFCPRCGAAAGSGPSAPQPPQGTTCARCGARLTPGSLFCDQCGAMTGAASASPPPQSPTGRRATPPPRSGRAGQSGQAGAANQSGYYNQSGQPGPSQPYGQSGQAGAANQSGYYNQSGQPGPSQPYGQPGQAGAPNPSGYYNQSGQPGSSQPYGQPGQAGAANQSGYYNQSGQPGSSQPYGQPGQANPSGPSSQAGQPARPPRRKKRLGKKVAALIAVGGVLVIAALALVAVPMVIQLINPRAYLTACAANTMARLSSASQATADALGVGDILDSAADGRVEQHLTLGLGELPPSVADYSTRQLLSGASLSLDSQSDLPGRKLGLRYTLSLGGMELGSATLAMDDDLISAGSPEFTGGTFYGFHSETMGADFNANPAFQGSIDPSVSFNVFDLIDRWRQEKLLLTDATLARLGQLNAQLVDQMAVERDGSTVTAVITPAVARDWLRGMYDAVCGDENLRSYLELSLEGSGTSLDEMTQALGEQLDRALEYLQDDVHVTFTIQDGIIARMAADTVVDGVSIRAQLELGTGAHPMDGFTLQMDLEQPQGGESMSILWTSQGNHSAQGGTYVDESRVEVANNGAPAGRVEWSTIWEPGGTGDNFTWTLSAWDGSVSREVLNIDVSGAVTVDRRAGSLEADLNNITLGSGGESFSMSLLYSIAPCDQITLVPDAGQVVLVPQMSQGELEDLLWEIQYSAMEALYGLQGAGW